MRWLIDYFRTCFCKHDFQLLCQNNVYATEFSKMPKYVEYTYMCKKCGYVKKVKA